MCDMGLNVVIRQRAAWVLAHLSGGQESGYNGVEYIVL